MVFQQTERLTDTVMATVKPMATDIMMILKRILPLKSGGN